MINFFNKTKWLVIFFDKEDELVFLSRLTRLSEAGLKPQPYISLTMSGSALKKIGAKPGVENEIGEEFSQTVLNDIIQKKKDNKANRLAVVLNRKLFGKNSEEAFIEVVRDTYFNDTENFAICGNMNYLSIKERLECYQTPCSQCGKLSDRCIHSCLPRLLWLLFDKDDQVIGILKQMQREEQSEK